MRDHMAYRSSLVRILSAGIDAELGAEHSFDLLLK